MARRFFSHGGTATQRYTEPKAASPLCESQCLGALVARRFYSHGGTGARRVVFSVVLSALVPQWQEKLQHKHYCSLAVTAGLVLVPVQPAADNLGIGKNNAAGLVEML